MNIHFSLAGTLLAATVLLCGPVQAQSLPEGAPSIGKAAPGQGEQQAMAWFNFLDRNKDGKLAWDEVKGIPFLPIAREFKAADANGDGFVTPDEIRVLSRKRIAERRAREAQEAAAREPAHTAAPSADSMR